MRKLIAALLLAVMTVPLSAGAASATNAKEKVDCLFYQTFRERDPDDYAECLVNL